MEESLVDTTQRGRNKSGSQAHILKSFVVFLAAPTAINDVGIEFDP